MLSIYNIQPDCLIVILLPLNRQTAILKGDVRDVVHVSFQRGSLPGLTSFLPRIYNAALDACSSGGIHVMLLFMQAICQEAAAWHLLNFRA